jgi:hypothetical protein
MRGCSFAEDFVTATRVEDNNGTFGGTGYSVDHQFDCVGSGSTYASFDNVTQPDDFSVKIQFSTTTTHSQGILITNADELVGVSGTLGDDGFAVWIDGDGVKANHNNGGTPPTECEVDFTYTAGAIHTVTYSVDMNGGTHTLRVDALTPDTQSTTIDEEIGDTTLTYIGGTTVYFFTGTIYKARIFNNILTAAEHTMYAAGTETSFMDAATAVWRCDAQCDNTENNTIMDKGVNSLDLYKADRVTSARFPTFVVDKYQFDGVDDHIANFPSLPASYTITAATSTVAAPHPVIQQHNDTTLLYDLENQGDYTGFLHSLILHPTVLTQIQLYHDEYQHLYWLTRTWAFGAYHRLITEDTCRICMFLDDATDTYQDYSSDEILGVATLVTKNGADGCTFESATSRVTVDCTGNVLAPDGEGTIGILGTFDVGNDGYVLYKTANYYLRVVYPEDSPWMFRIMFINSFPDMDIPNADVANGALEHIAVTFKSGEYPRFYLNGEFYDVGITQVAPDDSGSTDLIIGNNGTPNDPFESYMQHVFITDKALTDAEVYALFHEARSINRTIETS